MNAADRVRRELAEGYAAGNVDVAELLAERDRLADALGVADSQRHRLEGRIVHARAVLAEFDGTGGTVDGADLVAALRDALGGDR